MNSMRQLLKRSGRYGKLLLCAEPSILDTGLLIVGIITAVASGIPFPLLGVLFGQLMDDINAASCNDPTSPNSPDYQSSVDDKVLMTVYIGVANLALIYLYIVSWNLFGERLAQRLREKYFRSLLHKDITFFDHFSPGKMSSHLNADIAAIQSGTSEKVGIVINAVSFFLTAYTIAFIKDARLGGILVSLTPAFLLMSLVGGHYIGKYSGVMASKMSSVTSIALESLSNIMVVHALGANARLEARFIEVLNDVKLAGIRKAITISIQSGLLYFIAYSSSALAYWQGSKSIAAAVGGSDEGTTVGTIYTVIFILVDATIILSTVAPFLQIFGAAQTVFEQLAQQMEHKSEIGDRLSENQPLQGYSAAFELCDVSFVYPSRPNAKVLSRVSLKCPAMKNTAIIGLSGSGKSTIANLLMRFYDPTEGAVSLGDRNLKGLEIASLRGCMSYVQQEATLFNRSILENIALGLVNSSRHSHLTNTLYGPDLAHLAEAIRHGVDIHKAASSMSQEVMEIVKLIAGAASLADASDFICRLQNGYGTIVGSKGTLISGGQKQRIALARALVKDPAILILDEATASLDSSSERRIQSSLEKASKGRTTVTIAHRLSTIQDAHNIIVMQAGEVAEQGTHNELVERKGIYFDLLNLQTNEAHTSRTKSDTISESWNDVDILQSEEEKCLNRSSSQIRGSIQPLTSVAVADDKDPDIDTQRSLRDISHTLSPLFQRSRLLVFTAFIAVIIVGGTYSASATIFGNTIGTLSPCKSPSRIEAGGRFFALMFFVLAIAEFIANIVSWSGFGTVAERLLHQVRTLSFRSLLEQDLDWHESANRSPTSLLALITSDGNALAGLTGSTVGTVFSISVNLFAAIILTHILAWKLALVCLAAVPIILGAGSMQLIVLGRFAKRHQEAFTSSVGIAVEAIDSIRTVSAYSLQGEVLETYRRSLEVPQKEVLSRSLYANVWLALAYGLPTFIYALAYWWGSKLVIAGEYTQVQFFVVLIALLVSAQLWGQLFTIAPDLSKAFAAAKRIINLLQLGSTRTLRRSNDVEEMTSPEKQRNNTGGSRIKFSEVDFSYPARPSVQVLKSLSLTIEPGQFVALVGQSGAGKSTVIQLLERMYRVNTGAIEIDGVDIASESPTYRDAIAFVPQDSVLFDGTIRFNVALGAPSTGSVTNHDIEEACRLANIHEVIMALPQGYETNYGTGGAQLSGGQKQRVAIARALVRKPRILLLDESTSALDAESEGILRAGLEQVRANHGTTVIAVAHRLNTIQNADIIFYIENGLVKAQGTHEELMSKSEAYRTNAKYQGFSARN